MAAEKPKPHTKQEEAIPAEAISEKELEKIESVVEGKPVGPEKAASENVMAWKPKTTLGKKVVKGEITELGDVLDRGDKILEAEIVDILLPNIQNDLLLIGQARGKFGGGQRRVFKTTQKKTKEGNKPKFTTCAVVGNEDGFVGVGQGKSIETVPSREKAIRRAKLNIMKIRRGCGSWKCNCGEPHSIPYQVGGKCGSSEITLMPAPKGTGLKVEKECGKILKLAGIKDVWSKTSGQTSTKINLIEACYLALKNLTAMKVHDDYFERMGIIDGKLKSKTDDKEFMESMKAKSPKSTTEAEE